MQSKHKILSWETQPWEKTQQLFLRRIQARKYITIKNEETQHIKKYALV